MLDELYIGLMGIISQHRNYGLADLEVLGRKGWWGEREGEGVREGRGGGR